MEHYLNLHGNSGVQAFQLGNGSITVRFTGGWCYTYTNASAGAAHVQQMQQLAVDGAGLSAYITRFVRKKYATKTRC